VERCVIERREGGEGRKGNRREGMGREVGGEREELEGEGRRERRGREERRRRKRGERGEGGGERRILSSQNPRISNLTHSSEHSFEPLFCQVFW